MTGSPSKDFRLDDGIDADDDLKIGALADGLSTSAANGMKVDDDPTSLLGTANGDNRNNDSRAGNDINSKSDIAYDNDLATLRDAKDFDNLGIGGGDLTFDLSDDFSFNLNVDHILNNSPGGGGNDTGFSIVQANNLADQDQAYGTKMNNNDADNSLKADGGHVDGADGANFDTDSDWDLRVGEDLSSSSKAEASAILANSGFHQEIVQGANLLSNTVDVSVVGSDRHSASIGEDSDS